MKVILYFKKLNIGGAERSTVRLLNALADAGNEVTILVHTQGGALESELSDKVKISYFFKDTGSIRNWDHTIKGLCKLKLAEIIDACVQFIKGKFRMLSMWLRKPSYDLAITGWHGYSPEILKKYTRYKRHYQIIRNENAIAVDGKPQPFISKYSEQLSILDGYICISEYLRNMMLNYCKLDPERIVTIYNIINIKNTYLQHQECPVEYLPYYGKELIVVTVCRLVDGPKGLYRMVRVCKALTDKGYYFKWFVVGDGIDKDKMQQVINAAGLNDIMVLCGFKQNPVPYYQYAGLIAVLSYVEGLCGTVNEAKLLERPLIATRFSSIEEQIINNQNGLIVENDEDSIIAGMVRMFTDSKFREKTATNGMPQKLLDNSYKVQQFEDLCKE